MPRIPEAEIRLGMLGTCEPCRSVSVVGEFRKRE